MANRDVTVRLRAEIGNFEAAMKKSSEAAKAVGASVKTAGNDIDIFGNQLTDADKAAGRYINAAGRVVEANGKFAAGFDRNTEAAKAYRAELNAQLSPMQRLAQLQRENEQAWSTLSTTAMVAGGSMVAAVGSVVAKYASFDKAMSAVQASTHASGVEMEKLRELAMRAGADTAYSGEEAAAGINELAKAGVSTNDILRGGLTGALSLAAAGEIEVGDAAELAATAMTQFKLEGKDLEHVADLLAAGAGKAQGSVGDLGYALKQSGLVASQAGISIEETVGTLAAFASAGLVGSDAGTSFKVMLQKLQNPSDQAAQTLSELGVSMYDSQGNFVGMVELADQLRAGMEDLTPAQRDAAMATIFGSDAVRAANVLYAQGGAGIQDWINKVNDAGYAAETAAALQDNLAGDLEKLGGAFDTLALQSGGSLNDMFRDIVQGATNLLDLIGQIPGPVLTATTAIVGLGGAGLLTVGGIMKGVTAVAEFKDAASSLGITLKDAEGNATRFGAAMGGISKGLVGLAIIGGVVESFAALSRHMEEANISSSQLENAFADTANGVKNVDAAFANATWANGNGSTYWDGTVEGISGVSDALMHLQTRSGIEKFEDWGNDLLGFSSSSLQARDAVAELDVQLAGMASGGNLDVATASFKEWADQVEASGGSVEEMAKSFPELKNAVLDYASSLGVTLTEQETLQAMLGEMPPALLEAQAAAEGASAGLGGMSEDMSALAAEAEAAKMPLDELVEAFRVLGGIHMSETAAMGAYNEKLMEMQTQLAATGAGLDATGTRFDTTTEAGRNANAMISENVDAMWTLVEAQAANGASQETLQVTMAGTYNSMIASMEAMGLTTEQADILTRAVLGVPEGVSIDSWMSDKAYQMANETTSAVEGVPDGSHTDSSMSSAARDMANETQGAIRGIERNVNVTITTTRHEVLKKTVLGTVEQKTQSGAGRGVLKYTGGFASPSRGFFTGGMPGTFDSLRRYASGGLLPGVPPASPTMDNLPGYVVDTGEPVLLRSREYIVNEPGTWRGENLSWLRWMNAGGSMPTPAPRGFAVGGSPAALPASSAVSAPSSSGVDSAAIAGAVRAGLAGADFRFSIGGREFKAAIQDVNRQYGRP